MDNKKDENLYVINHKGKTLETKHFYEISDKEFEDIKNEYYSKPEFNNVVKEFKHDQDEDYYFDLNAINTSIYVLQDLLEETEEE